MMDAKLIGKSKEDYLEAILIQINLNGACRSTDVAAQLGFSKPSASIALKKLEDEGYIIRDDWKVLLTDKGRAIAQMTYDKHSFFKKWLKRTGIDEKTAEEEACQIEHIISGESFDKIKDYLKGVDSAL
jgi:Mn-dependent DtxR family transcriptional regulator